MFGRMRQAIKELKDEIDWSREFNADNADRITKLECEISNLKCDRDATAARIEVLESARSNHEARFNTHETIINRLAARVERLEAKQPAPAKIEPISSRFGSGVYGGIRTKGGCEFHVRDPLIKEIVIYSSGEGHVSFSKRGAIEEYSVLIDAGQIAEVWK